MHARVGAYPGLGLVVLGRVDVEAPAFGGMVIFIYPSHSKHNICQGL